MPKQDADILDEKQIVSRREEALKRMLSTPHKLHDESKFPRKPKAKKSPAKPKSA